MANSIDFKATNQTALSLVFPILRRWVPEGHLSGSEYVARNPTRSDQNLRKLQNQHHHGPLGRLRYE